MYLPYNKVRVQYFIKNNTANLTYHYHKPSLKKVLLCLMGGKIVRFGVVNVRSLYQITKKNTKMQKKSEIVLMLIM